MPFILILLAVLNFLAALWNFGSGEPAGWVIALFNIAMCLVAMGLAASMLVQERDRY